MDSTPVSLLERARLRPDDPGAWPRLMEVYQPWLEARLRREGLQPADVDDVVQEVLAVVCRELPGFRHNGRPGAFRAWLRQIVVNRLHEFRRQRPLLGRVTGLDQYLDQLADDRSELSRKWDHEHDRHIVATLLRAISRDFQPRTWQAFEAFVMEGRPAATVAAELGISEGAVWTAKSHVLRRLRQVARELID